MKRSDHSKLILLIRVVVMGEVMRVVPARRELRDVCRNINPNDVYLFSALCTLILVILCFIYYVQSKK